MDIPSYLLGKKAGGGSPTPPKLQEKSVTVTSNGTQDITADSGYDGLDKVELTTNVTPSLQTKNITISSNGTQTVVNDIAYDGLDEVNITTNVTPNNQSKSLTITENTTTTISPDLGYDGLSEVEITTNVSGGTPNITNISELNTYSKLLFDNYYNNINSNVNNYEAYTDENITLYTPNENTKKYMIQMKSNGKFRIVWGNEEIVKILSSSYQEFNGYKIHLADSNITRTKDFSQFKDIIFDITYSNYPTSDIIFFYSKDFDTFQELIQALQDNTQSSISYTEYRTGTKFSGVINNNYPMLYSNCPIIDNTNMPILNGKIISHNETITTVSNS